MATVQRVRCKESGVNRDHMRPVCLLA